MAQSNPVASNPFRVVIVGAGFVGLSLSHALQLANIDHVVLEKHDKVVSIKGAALIIFPGVARIFDQFGILEKIHQSTTPITVEYRRWPDGSLNSSNHFLQRLADLFDIKSILSDRHAIVTHLYENLPDRSKIRTGKRIERIEHTDIGVRVHLADGSIEEGDIVIGADGVHSTVRSLMWDYANESEPGSIPETDKQAMTSEFRAIFGVSTREDSLGLGPAESHTTFGHGDAKLLFTQPEKAYWAMIFKDERSPSEKRGRTTEEELEVEVKRLADRPMAEGVKLLDLWETKTRHGIVDLEEGILEKWHAGRMVLVGDSAHKMTADLAIGANMAVESAVFLCNILHRELKANPNRHMSTSELSDLFAEYQNGRFGRAKAFVTLSGQATRRNTYQTYLGRFYISYIAPYLMSIQTLKIAESFVQSPKLDYAPVRTINENAEGWHLGKQKEKKAKTGLLPYVLLTSMVGATIAYLAMAK